MANVTKKTTDLTPAQRSANFNLQTRQYIQSLGTMTFGQGQTISQIMPKSRFAQKLTLLVSGTFTCTHATKTTFVKSQFDKYNILKQIRLNYNSGFNPYQISGSKLYLHNLITQGRNKFLDSDVFATNVLQNVVAVGGAINTIKFALDCPLSINERDTIGLINLQNLESSLTLEIDCDNVATVMTDTDITVSAVNITITPVLTTFSVPALPDAVPDYSILKLVNEDARQIIGNGENRFILQTGLTYRRIMFYITSDGVTPIANANLTKIQLAFNQADTPYSVSSDYLAYKNKLEYQGSLPVGCYCIDFADSGQVNYAGARDYVDTESLTQFELVLTFSGLAGNNNKIYIIPEKLAKLN